MIVIRTVLGIIAAVVMSLMLCLAGLGGGLMTLYWGLVDGDWRQEQWREFFPTAEEAYDDLYEYVLHG